MRSTKPRVSNSKEKKGHPERQRPSSLGRENKTSADKLSRSPKEEKRKVEGLSLVEKQLRANEKERARFISEKKEESPSVTWSAPSRRRKEGGGLGPSHPRKKEDEEKFFQSEIPKKKRKKKENWYYPITTQHGERGGPCVVRRGPNGGKARWRHRQI